MGALTSKLYTYKARPWELSSHATISIQDPFLTRIYIDARDNKILRILPLVGTEEWIQDSTRFFISVNKLKNAMIKFELKFSYNVENSIIHSKKIAADICLATDLLYKISHKIYQSAKFTVIVDKLTDAKTMNVLRLFNKHKNYIDIKLANSFVTFNNNLFDGSLFHKFDNPFLFLIQNKKMESLLQSKIINYKNSLSTNDTININFYEALYLAEARYLLGHNIKTLMFGLSGRFFSFFPFIQNKIILDSLLHMAPFSKIDSLSFSQKNMNNLSLDINSVFFGDKQNFAFSDAIRLKRSIKYIFPKTNFFSQSLFFINLFGEINKTSPISASSYIHDNLLILINLSLIMSSLPTYVNIYLHIFKLNRLL